MSQWGVLKEPRRFWKDLIPLALHVALWFGVPVFVFGVEPARAVWVYVLPLFFLGPYLAALFWLNHIGMPLVSPKLKFDFRFEPALAARSAAVVGRVLASGRAIQCCQCSRNLILALDDVRPQPASRLGVCRGCQQEIVVDLLRLQNHLVDRDFFRCRFGHQRTALG